ISCCPGRRDESRRGTLKRAPRRRLDASGSIIVTPDFRLLVQIAPLFISPARCSEARQERAIIQVVMPCVPGKETKQLASVTYRFFTSCDWQNGFSTLVLGSVPMRAAPHS